MDDIKRYIREVPDFPKPGILFYDITTLLQDARGLRLVLDRFGDLFADLEVDKVVGIESRGFLFGPHLAHRLDAGFVPVRKPGKLPSTTLKQSYALEYGTDQIEIHNDALRPGERVLIVDDLIATGGTAAATAQLVQATGAEITAMGFVIELTFLPGRDQLGGHRVESLVTY
ncbi:MAG: adenine phosphoribosyltransferase [Acidobacteriota bacterium]